MPFERRRADSSPPGPAPGEAPIPGSAVLNDLVLEEPAVLEVLHRHGLDTCCGGHLTLREACRRHELDLEPLVAELEGVLRRGSRGGADGSPGAATGSGDFGRR